MLRVNIKHNLCTSTRLVARLPTCNNLVSQRRGFKPFFSQIINSQVLVKAPTKEDAAASEAPEIKPVLIKARVPLLKSPTHFGHYTSRVDRPRNEDRYFAGVLELPIGSTFSPRASHKVVKHEDGHESQEMKRQVFMYSVFDGHGGEDCSQFLKDNLAEYIENCDVTKGEEIIQKYQQDFGGYWRRWKNQLSKYISKMSAQDDLQLRIPLAFLNADYDYSVTLQSETNARLQKQKPEGTDQSIINNPQLGSSFPESTITKSTIIPPSDSSSSTTTTSIPVRGISTVSSPSKSKPLCSSAFSTSSQSASSRITPRFGTTDRNIGSGSTCTTVLIYTDSTSHKAYWDPSTISQLTVAHVGDTRCIISDRFGEAHPLTSNHHPSSPFEANRLKRYASSFFVDSFGEERFGVFANTRSFGDLRMKSRGVSAEPDVTQYLIGDTVANDHNGVVNNKIGDVKTLGGDEAFLVIVSDGVSDQASDQEIVDIVVQTANQSGSGRGTPQQAAMEVVRYVEALGGDDNATCLVIRLSGWGKWPERTDRTGELREHRLKNAFDRKPRGRS